MLLRSSYFMSRRLLRGRFYLLIFFLLPIIAITIFGAMADDAVDEELGLLVKDVMGVTLVISPLLFGGYYTLEFINGDLFSNKRWRMQALPCSLLKHAISILLACTLFSGLQGLTMALYTQQVFGVNWGSIGLSFAVLFIISLFSHLVFLIIALGIRNYKNELGQVYGFGSLALTGVWFGLPEGIIRDLATYTNPISLGRNVIFASITGVNINRGIISFGILLSGLVVLAWVAAILGRRKLI